MRLGALDHNLKYCSPHNAIKGKAYTCVECKDELVLCKGTIRIPYFRHYADTNCNYYNHPNESQIHKDAKYKMKSLLENESLTITRTCGACLRDTTFCIPKADKAMVEYSFDDNNKRLKADVACIHNNDLYIIEVLNTHITTNYRPEPWFEIKASDIVNDKFICTRQTDCKPCYINSIKKIRDDTHRINDNINHHKNAIKRYDHLKFYSTECVWARKVMKQMEDEETKKLIKSTILVTREITDLISKTKEVYNDINIIKKYNKEVYSDINVIEKKKTKNLMESVSLNTYETNILKSKSKNVCNDINAIQEKINLTRLETVTLEEKTFLTKREIYHKSNEWENFNSLVSRGREKMDDIRSKKREELDLLLKKEKPTKEEQMTILKLKYMFK